MTDAKRLGNAFRLGTAFARGMNVCQDYEFIESKHKRDKNGRFASVNAESAPNPRNTKAVSKWNSLPRKEQAKRTIEQVSSVIQRVAKSMNAKIGRTQMQVGGWLGDTNYSTATTVQDPNKAVEIAKRLGRKLRQQGVMVFSDVEGKDLTKSPAIYLRMDGFTPEQVEQAYTTIHGAVGTKDENEPNKIIGMSYQNGAMIIGLGEKDTNPKDVYQKVVNSLKNSELEGKIEGYLGETYSAYVDTRTRIQKMKDRKLTKEED